MEKLILGMMGWADITEEKLREKQLITTGFGETLSWEYLCYVRNHPVNWSVPTYILYGDKDNLTSQETIHKFVNDANAELNSHARLACYTMNKTGVASGNFYKKILFPM